MVWAFTELMVEGSEPAIIEFYRREKEAMQGRVAAPLVKMLAPVGVSYVSLMSGRGLMIPADRLIEITEADAKSLERIGWLRASTFLPARPGDVLCY